MKTTSTSGEAHSSSRVAKQWAMLCAAQFFAAAA
jgi:hypothetical protein